MPPNLPTVTEPFPISLIHNRYLLFSIDKITYIRRVHHITGVLIGSIPQIPQQNVFLGIPLELMPEEARLLVGSGAAYIVDDVQAHKEGLRGLRGDERVEYLRGLEAEGKKAARLTQAKKDERTEKALKRIEEKKTAFDSATEARDGSQSQEDENSEESLFAPAPNRASSPAPSQTLSTTFTSSISTYAITPTTSYPPLPTPPRSPAIPLPEVPASYPLFAHLHANGYFISPGLRFGCQYLVYPGDPLRFHSHFLATGTQWDEEIDLLDLVGGGRLGTGVKKGFLIGGVEKKGKSEDDEVLEEGRGWKEERVRTFCIEWGGM
ncbi:MAG: tRNA-splicing endonuclease subunit [Pleopsidium flavum]|nr:MAG: tRNA-splicing endonuclease subunit [Pleopsidium flavum]